MFLQNELFFNRVDYFDIISVCKENYFFYFFIRERQHANIRSFFVCGPSIRVSSFLHSKTLNYGQLSLSQTLKGPAKMFEIARVQDIEK